MKHPVLICLLATLLNAVTSLAQDRPPSFIVILADDIGAGELGCYGHPEHRTPNLDRLAAGGAQFATCFTSPVCHPTRFTVMTGQYGFRTGVLNFGGKRAGPPPGEDGPDNIARHLTFAQLLKPAGYATALAGKWQLSGRPPTLIHETGFDDYLVWGYRSYFPEAELEKAQAAGVDFRSRYWRPSLCRNGQWVPTTEDDYGPDHFAAFIIDFIRKHRDQPFFIYYPMALTHTPWLPTPDTLQPGMDRFKHSKTNLQANVEYLDKIIGRIAAALEETGAGGHTVLLFTGDNGTGGDGKSTATEKGARVPLIVSGPPHLVKPRGLTPRLADTSDVFPTLMDYAGVTIPEKHVVDGRSLAPFLRGEREETREWIFAYQADYRILRTERWLLEENSPRQFGKLWDCGESRDGSGYREVTDSAEPEPRAARAYFENLLKDLPAPLLDHDGPPNENIAPKDKSNKEKRRERKKAASEPDA